MKNTVAKRAKVVKYANFWSRLLACLLDTIIVYILNSMAILLVGFIIVITGVNILEWGFIVTVIVGWLYFAISESSHKQSTLGKQALGIIVTDLKGERLSFGKATARYFCKWLSNLTLFIGYIMAFTHKKQALHDMIAGTLVLTR